MRRKSVFLAIIPVLALQLIGTNARAALPVSFGKNVSVESCQFTPDIECVKTFTAIDANGQRYTGVPTGRKLYTPRPTDDGTGYNDEYSFKGLTFEGSAKDRVLPEFMFMQYGSHFCGSSPNNCEQLSEGLVMVIRPSWLDRNAEDEKNQLLKLTHRQSDLLCGRVIGEAPCYRDFQFNQDITFEVTIQMPETFIPVYAHGTTRNFSLAKGNSVLKNGVDFYDLTFRAGNITEPAAILSPVVKEPGYAPSEYADFQTDTIGLEIDGSRADAYKRLSPCADKGIFTVFANSTFQGTPEWKGPENGIYVMMAGPHYFADGTVVNGYFQAAIPTAAAQCLWNLDLTTKAIAQVKVLYDNDNSGTQAETISGKTVGENFVIDDNNFHYSNPTFAINLVASKKEIPLPTPTIAAIVPTPTSSSTLSNRITRTISCIKGKEVKKITGLNPICPKGYKLKK